MLTPARAATAFVLKPSKPSVSRICAAASTIDATVSSERDWVGVLRGRNRFCDERSFIAVSL